MSQIHLAFAPRDIRDFYAYEPGVGYPLGAVFDMAYDSDEPVEYMPGRTMNFWYDARRDRALRRMRAQLLEDFPAQPAQPAPAPPAVPAAPVTPPRAPPAPPVCPGAPPRPLRDYVANPPAIPVVRYIIEHEYPPVVPIADPPRVRRIGNTRFPRRVRRRTAVYPGVVPNWGDHVNFAHIN